MTKNVDHDTVQGFGQEWSSFDQQRLSAEQRAKIFHDYFGGVPVGRVAACGAAYRACLVARAGLPPAGTVHRGTKDLSACAA